MHICPVRLLLWIYKKERLPGAPVLSGFLPDVRGYTKDGYRRKRFARIRALRVRKEARGGYSCGTTLSDGEAAAGGHGGSDMFP